MVQNLCPSCGHTSISILANLLAQLGPSDAKAIGLLSVDVDVSGAIFCVRRFAKHLPFFAALFRLE
eukprot:SAG22_NODE_9746_length_572_cov_0.871036_2_plen_66_part_00